MAVAHRLRILDLVRDAAAEAGTFQRFSHDALSSNRSCSDPRTTLPPPVALDGFILVDMPIRDDRRLAASTAIAVRSLKALLVLAAVSIAKPNLIAAAAEARR
jgi:hypothetical protein